MAAVYLRIHNAGTAEDRLLRLSTPVADRVQVHETQHEQSMVRMREVIAQNKDIAKKLAQLESRIESQDEAIVEVVQAVRELMDSRRERLVESRPKRKIGFV